jgi:hypothetical protein
MTDALVDDDGLRALTLTVNLGRGVQLGGVSDVLADISAVLAAGAALDAPRGGRGPRPRGLARYPELSEVFFLDWTYSRAYQQNHLPPMTFDVPGDTFVLERVAFENPVSVTGALTALAGFGIPSILRIIRDWTTDRRIQAARAADAEDRQRQSARFRAALVDRLVDELDSKDPEEVNATMTVAMGAIERLMDRGLEVVGLYGPEK